MYKARISTLEEGHRILDKQITEMQKESNFDEQKITELKKKKLIPLF